jgi:fumarate reductase iron-sulfur subunit
MKINIKRFSKDKPLENKINQYNINEDNLLNALFEIKTKIDATLTFRSGCKSGVCGSCAVRVNGVEKLACKTKIKNEDLIEAIKNSVIIRDLVVDVSHETILIKKTSSFIKEYKDIEITQNDINSIDLQSNCILCNACYSSCPVYEVNKDFLGPFALTRALRYINDKKNASSANIVNNVQTNGIWDCTLCSACTLVCPQGIDSKADIMQLQNISVQNGYNNPNMQSFDFGTNFDDDFGGFNPNGF